MFYKNTFLFVKPYLVIQLIHFFTRRQRQNYLKKPVLLQVFCERISDSVCYNFPSLTCFFGEIQSQNYLCVFAAISRYHINIKRRTLSYVENVFRVNDIYTYIYIYIQICIYIYIQIYGNIYIQYLYSKPNIPILLTVQKI